MSGFHPAGMFLAIVSIKENGILIFHYLKMCKSQNNVENWIDGRMNEGEGTLG